MEKEVKAKEVGTNKPKGFWGRFVEKLDKKMEEKSKKSPCCGPDPKGGKCC